MMGIDATLILSLVDNFLPNLMFCVFVYLLTVLILWMLSRLTPVEKKRARKSMILKWMSSSIVYVAVVLTILLHGSTTGTVQRMGYDKVKMNTAIDSSISYLHLLTNSLTDLQSNFRAASPTYVKIENIKEATIMTTDFILKTVASKEFARALDTKDSSFPVPPKELLRLQGRAQKLLKSPSPKKMSESLQLLTAIHHQWTAPAQSPNMMISVNNKGRLLIHYQTPADLQKQKQLVAVRQHIDRLLSFLNHEISSAVSSLINPDTRLAILKDLNTAHVQDVLEDAYQVGRKTNDSVRQVGVMLKKIVMGYSRTISFAMTEAGVVIALLPSSLLDAPADAIMKMLLG